MKPLITLEDLRDLYIKLYQRGFSFVRSKFVFNHLSRTKSAFNDASLQTANWWTVPLVRKRWNLKVTKDEYLTYEEHISNQYFSKEKSYQILSIGSGVCSHEIKMASLMPNVHVSCFDFSNDLIAQAKSIAEEKKLQNISFYVENVYQYPFPKKSYDVVFFHASLHHFKEINSFLSDMVIPVLKDQGLLIINEYVGQNRMIFPAHQLQAINRALKIIPKKYRKIFRTNLYKNKYYGSGFLRMYLSDPSECVDSENILKEIHEKFYVLEEKPYGGNLLMSVLKDLSQHFVSENEDNIQILHQLFEMEDQYLETYPSDFVFGVYRLK